MLIRSTKFDFKQTMENIKSQQHKDEGNRMESSIRFCEEKLHGNTYTLSIRRLDMSVEEILEILRTSIETKDWDVISELIETLSYEGESDGDEFKEYLEDFDD